MEIILYGSLIFIIAALIAAVAVMLNIRTILKKLHGQLHTLDEKIEQVPLPRNQVVNLEKFTAKIREILHGIRSIRPGQ